MDELNISSHFSKTVRFRLLRIFNGLLQTKSVKKYNILTEKLQDEKNNKFTSRKMKKL